MSKNIQTAIDFFGELVPLDTVHINLESGFWVKMCPRYVKGKLVDYAVLLYHENTIYLASGDFFKNKQEAEKWGRETVYNFVRGN